MTHIAWAPEEWADRARETLAGMAERHPSRTIMLVPLPDSSEDGIDADVSIRCFAVADVNRSVCSEVIELRLRGRRAKAPASIATPLLVSDLPVFCRWRGQPPFGAPELEQLVRLTDRLVVDSEEWDDLPYAYTRLAPLFERTAISDIAWQRTEPWRAALAKLWPGIADAGSLRVRGPQADALLLAGWLRSRLRTEIELAHDPAPALESVAVDGSELPPPRADSPGPSDLLSNELDRYGRDRVYEEAARAASAR